MRVLVCVPASVCGRGRVGLGEEGERGRVVGRACVSACNMCGQDIHTETQTLRHKEMQTLTGKVHTLRQNPERDRV